ncbi:MAG: transglycosylase SLT domain-containing protein [Candidatus Marinarcus sp.]|uniref:transglycosylase SLT domain-containing protein n=1 Tax=Candidatus Marinarcus sp. TaxID=3100987 RepID=UPI003AFF7181
MKRYFITLLILFFTYANGENFKSEDLTHEDLSLLKQIKEYAQKYDLAYSLMAIAVKESSLGRYKVNVDSYDYGLYQANINTVIRRHQVRNSTFNRNRMAMLLINDFEFATSNAIAELIYWKKIYGNNWSKIWASYNAGFNNDSSKAIKYSKDIEKIIIELKKVDALNS